MNRRYLILLAIAALLSLAAAYSLTRPAPEQGSVLTLISGGYRLDKLYRSMEGPWSVQSNIQISPRSPNAQSLLHLVWITGIQTQVVDANDQTPRSQEFFCHSNLTFAENSGSIDRYNAELGGKTHLDWRLFTLAPGRTSIELPPGFGVPVPADATLDYLTMSLNLNPRKETPSVRMRTTLHTIGANEPGAPTKALFRRAVYVLQNENQARGVAHACSAKSVNGQSNASAARTSNEPVGLGCGEWMKMSQSDGSTVLMPSEGMTNHWSVPQGDHIYTSDITPQLNLPFDTTIHYATIHVHPFARWMELRDLTAGKTVLRLTSQDLTDRIGVAQVDEFKSIDGVPIVRSHRYQLAVEYNNTSAATTDAMAILYLYLRDKI